MHSHAHDHCEHEMAHCKVCDIAYCRKCAREWGKWVWSQPYRPYWGTTTIGTTTVAWPQNTSVESHVHQ